MESKLLFLHTFITFLQITGYKKKLQFLYLINNLLGFSYI